MSTTILWIISGVLALLPVLIWLYILFKDKKHDKLMLALIFSGGILATLGVFAIQWIWGFIPEIDPFLWIENNISDPTYYFVAIFVMVGVFEEIFKQGMVRYVDTKKVLIQTVNDSIRFSLAAALGFAFAENIIYFKTVMEMAAIQEVVVTFLFRSIFTAAAHMIFSGIFGFFFGIGKFSIDISKHKQWQGRRYLGPHFIGRIFKMPFAQAFKEWKILQGLTLAIVLHAIFNYLLEMNQLIPVIIMIVLCFTYLMYLLKRKAGNLILVTDITEKKSSKMVKNDTDVVLELMGMWFDQKKYVDVLHICERLLERDPDNNVVKLFKAKAQDKIDPNNPYNKALGAVLGKNRSEKDVNTITYYRQKQEAERKDIPEEEKEKLRKAIVEKQKKRQKYYKL
ncbi:PrsW family glutamic-type intramembrane protease [Patescibacteria group bacterium]